MRGYRLTTYHQWIEQEGVPLVRGHGVTDVRALELRPWPRLGAQGAYIDLMGMEGLTGMYVAEIPPGGVLNPEKHLYDELIYILSGHGTTKVWSGDREDQARVFEWQPGSLFAPPMNTSHQFFNVSGTEPARFLGVTIAPPIMDLFHNVPFIFNCDWVFDDRYDGRPDFFEVGERNFFEPGGVWLFETNFIPDVRSYDLKPGSKMGAGWGTVYQMDGNVLGGHITEWPVGRYRKAHYHGGGSIILVLNGKGYTLLWPSELGLRPFESEHGDQVVRVDWQEGSVYSPPSGWFHQHFNTSPGKVRQVALRLGSQRYGVYFHDIASREGVLRSTRDGGTLIEFEDEDPEIPRLYKEELASAGVDYEMEETPVF